MHSYVILVDENDRELGTMEKMEAHEKGILHRAFSVIIFNSQGEMLVQQRAIKKYHSGGLWTNACCSHPFPREEIKQAAERRLFEEMGIHCNLQPSGYFKYRCEFDNGLTEHEFDHVLKGIYNDDPNINPDEVEAFKWVELNMLKEEMNAHPFNFTFWFLQLLSRNFF